MRISEPIELVVLASAGVYVFWRWAEHAAHGAEHQWLIASFNAVMAAMIFVLLYICVTRGRIRLTPRRGIAATAVLAIALCFIASLWADLEHPQRKEMRQLVASQPNIIAGSESQWIQGVVLRIRHDFRMTILLVCLLGCYISRLPTVPEGCGDATNNST